MNKRTLLASLESPRISHPAKSSSYFRGLLNVHMCVHALKSLVKIKGSKFSLSGAEVLWIIHSVVDLVLMLV